MPAVFERLSTIRARGRAAGCRPLRQAGRLPLHAQPSCPADKPYAPPGRWFLLLAVLFALGVLSASVGRAAEGGVAAEFSAANKLYAEGKFTEAAAGWGKVIQEAQAAGTAAPALYFNYGNAEFKLGHLGLAIAAYRHAALLAPRDSEVLGNLEFVRNQVQGATVRPGRWQSWVGALTLNEGTLLTAAALWLTFLLLMARQIRPALAPRLRGLTVTATVVTLLSGAVLAVQAAGHFSRQTAVVTEANVIARSGPYDDALKTFAVHDGAELSVLDRHDDWFQVADGTGKTGWLPRKQLELLPGA